MCDFQDTGFAKRDTYVEGKDVVVKSMKERLDPFIPEWAINIALPEMFW